MLFWERVAVYCENHTEHTNTDRNSQETHYVSTSENNRLMLFGETVAVYSKSKSHYDRQSVGQSILAAGAREPYGTHKSRSYLTGNTLLLCYRDKPVNDVWGNSRCLLWEPYGTHRYSSYFTGNTLRLRYKTQPVNAVWGNSRCLLWEPYGTHRYSQYLTGNSLRLRYKARPVNAV
jgi:hypothetical protein